MQRKLLLPRKKVFKFPKRTKPFFESVDNSRTVHEIREPSPTPLKTVAKLNVLLKSKKDSASNREQVLRRLEQLESKVKSNITEIRFLLKKL